jgi:hypothetical protein
MHGAPQRQYWQGNQNNSGYTPQAGPSNYNSGYKPAPYKKFGAKKPNYKPNNQNPGYNSNTSGSKGPNGPNWERNRQNRQNKKQVRVLLKEQVAKLESQSKPDTKGKKKEKAGKSANLLARIDDIPLESRMEDIDSYNERVFIAPKSNKTDVVKQIVDKMEVDNEDAVSLGNDSVYSNARDFYANNALDGDDWDKYGDGLLNKEFANLNHTVPITVEMAKQPSNSSQRYSSNVVNTAGYNKTVYTVNRVIKANEAKTSLLAEIEDDTWIIDSGASHHITTKLTDYTSYQPYPEPEIIQTANAHDSLKIHGEGTVFFNTETTNGQIHTVRLDNVCYIPNGSNRLLSQGQLCLEGLVEKADSKSTTFSLPTGHVFLRGFPRNETDTLHWVRSTIAHPNVPMAEPSLFLVNYNTWHLRMAHPSKNVLRHIGTNTNGFTPNLTFPLDSGICPGCAKGKMHNKPFPPSGKRAKQRFDLIHADLVQLPKKSYHKKEWACLLMDDYSSYAYCYLLRSKSEATSAITTFLELIKNQLTKVIKKFRSDHGGEFDNNSLHKIFASKGIVHEYSAPIAEMDLLKINLKYVHQVKTRIKRTITIPPIPIQTRIITMMILITRILQMIHIVIRRKNHHQKKKALNQRKKKMKSRMISNHLQNPLTMKNLLMDVLEEAVSTLLMKNPRKVVTTAVNLTKDHRAIPMIHLKNLNLVRQGHVDHLGFPNP